MEKELQRLRQMLITFVQARSTELIRLAQRKSEEINSIKTLNELALNVGPAHSAEEVRCYPKEAKDK
ncbi:MAG: hypothetical protein PVSMB2_17990 [Ktedonobacteraceae bacterium]